MELNNQILEGLNKQETKRYWFIHKDLIDICKNCEYRRMCIDPRVPNQRNDKSWFYQGECEYNPYIAKWSGADGYKTLAECGVISNANGFSIDEEKIAEINAKLWGE